jgi:1-acyl-sn-glycerol-3-phosphate acyltransferase
VLVSAVSKYFCGMSDQPSTSTLGDYNEGFEPPSLDFIDKIIALPKAYFNPTFVGLEDLDATKPALFVTNHSIVGALDGTQWVAELYRQKGIFPLSLVDDLHYKVPGWRDLAKTFGFVKGSRENCTAMMEAGESLVVYPGGMRETVKRHGEAYQLTWKKRTGFARMAIQHGYDIIPVAQVGNEEAFQLMMDPDEMMDTPFGDWLKEKGYADKFLKGGEHMFPLVRGIGPTPFPKPEQQFYGFGPRISTSEYDGNIDEDILWKVREEVETRLELLITQLRIQKLEAKQGEEGWRKFLNRL